MKALWNGVTIAESEQSRVVDGYTYFPPESVRPGVLREAAHTSVCSWKGLASYYDIVTPGKTNADAAWCYRTPTPAAAEIAGWVGFWKGVVIAK